MIKSLLWSIAIVAIGASCGWIYAKVAPPVYEARLAVSAVSTSGVPSGGGSQAVAALLNQNSLLQLATQQSGFTLNGNRNVKIQGNPKGSFVEISVFGRDPAKTAEMANDLVSTYQMQTKSGNQKLLQQAQVRLKAAQSDASSKLISVENQIDSIEKSSGILNIDQRVQQVATYEETLNQLKDQTQTQLGGITSQIAIEKNELAAMPKTTQSNIIEGPNPVIEGYQQDLNRLQAKRVSLLEVWREQSSKVQAVESQIKAVQKSMTEARAPQLSVQSATTSLNPQRLTLERQLASDESQAANLNASLQAIGNVYQQQVQDAKSLPVAQSQMLDLTRKKKLAEGTYNQISTQLVSVGDGILPGIAPEIGAFSPATAPTVPVWPIASQTTEWGALVGLVLGVLTFFALMPRAVRLTPGFDYNSQSIALTQGSTDPELISRTSAPALPGRNQDGLSALSLPGSSPAEAYRFLVFALQSRGEDAPRTVLFTGVSSDGLCSEAAAQFAIAMAQTGTRTLLADCNLRHNSLTSAFGFSGKSGVSDVLGRTMLPVPGSDLMMETVHPGLFFLPCGTEESEGLASYQNLQVKGLVEEFESRADVKVINTAPCTILADAPRLARYVDEVYLIANASDENKGLVEKAKTILKLAGAKRIDLLVVDSKGAKQSFLG